MLNRRQFLNQLPDMDPSGDVAPEQVGLKRFTQSWDYHPDMRNPGRDDAEEWGKREPRMVSNRGLIAKHDLSVGALQHYTGTSGFDNSGRYEQDYESEPEAAVLNRHPNIAVVGRKRYVIGGHHRIAASILSGQTQVEARVMHVNRMKSEAPKKLTYGDRKRKNQEKAGQMRFPW